jgi:hypothetical protein
MPILDVTKANVVPTRASTPEGVRELLASDGAAIVSGVASEADAAALAAEILSDKLIRIGRQFEASKANYDKETPRIDHLPVDPRGRKKQYTAPSERMYPHNDGFSFGDFAPDYLFLWCERPAIPAGGDSFLIDAYKMVQLLAEDDETKELAAFCWAVDIDQSEPSGAQPYESPIARRVPSGRVQVRNHPYFMAKLGPTEAVQAPMVRRWQELLEEARDTGPAFRVAAGDMICADNYRVLHGRYEYEDVARTLYSIWGWTTEGVAVPLESLDISAPVVPTAG